MACAAVDKKYHWLNAAGLPGRGAACGPGARTAAVARARDRARTAAVGGRLADWAAWGEGAARHERCPAMAAAPAIGSKAPDRGGEALKSGARWSALG